MTLSEANRLQLEHKEIPHDISSDQIGKKMHHTIKHREDQLATISNPSNGNLILQVGLSGSKTTEKHITLKITKKSMKFWLPCKT